MGNVANSDGLVFARKTPDPHVQHKMTPLIKLRWFPPIEITVKRHRSLILQADLINIPTTRGMYVFATVSGSQITPLYIGLASRSIRQRLKQHLKSPRMIKGLSDTPAARRIFLYAELEAGDLESAKRYLPSLESALIQSATRIAGATLNTHQVRVRSPKSANVCKFINIGYRTAWAGWSPTRVTTVLLPPRSSGTRRLTGVRS
jgi:hypothetical protein